MSAGARSKYSNSAQFPREPTTWFRKFCDLSGHQFHCCNGRANSHAHLFRSQVPGLRW